MYDIDWGTPWERWCAIQDADRVGEWREIIEQGGRCPVCGHTGGCGHYATARGYDESPDDAEVLCPLCGGIDAKMAAACADGEGITVDDATAFEMTAPF
jgi:hypothetical protein